jgi:hypothetical protein
MKKEIQSFIKALNFVTPEELYNLLASSGSINRQTLLMNLAELEEAGAVIKILPKENSLGLEGYIPGPNIEVKNDIKIQRAIIEGGAERRDFSVVNLDKLCNRLEKSLNREAEDLKDRISNVYDDPKKLELDYFGLNIKYYALRRFFYEYFDTIPFEGLKSSLNECRRLLDNLEIK